MFKLRCIKTLIIIILLSPAVVISQDYIKIDSLRKCLSSIQQKTHYSDKDTSLIRLYIEIGKEYNEGYYPKMCVKCIYKKYIIKIDREYIRKHARKTRALNIVKCILKNKYPQILSPTNKIFHKKF
ncbi:MAG: hypothetical protein Kow0068_01670 [Marinilabiliales bacterium]